jgi:hypothetical protein
MTTPARRARSDDLTCFAHVVPASLHFDVAACPSGMGLAAACTKIVSNDAHKGGLHGSINEIQQR